MREPPVECDPYGIVVLNGTETRVMDLPRGIAAMYGCGLDFT